MTTPDYDPQPGQYGQPGVAIPAAGGQEPGGLLLRWVARLIDGILVAIVSLCPDLPHRLVVQLSGSTGLFTGLLTFVYFVAFEVSIGSTPGKKLLGLSVHGPGGAPKPTAAQSAIRNSWTLLPIIPLRRWAARLHRDHHHRGDHQRQPDQTGQARRARRRHSGRQGLTRAFGIVI